MDNIAVIILFLFLGIIIGAIAMIIVNSLKGVNAQNKANKLLYFIWQHPGRLSVALGRCAIGIFDRL